MYNTINGILSKYNCLWILVPHLLLSRRTYFNNMLIIVVNHTTLYMQWSNNNNSKGLMFLIIGRVRVSNPQMCDTYLRLHSTKMATLRRHSTKMATFTCYSHAMSTFTCYSHAMSTFTCYSHAMSTFTCYYGLFRVDKMKCTRCTLVQAIFLCQKWINLSEPFEV